MQYTLFFFLLIDVAVYVFTVFIIIQIDFSVPCPLMTWSVIALYSFLSFCCPWQYFLLYDLMVFVPLFILIKKVTHCFPLAPDVPYEC